MSFILHGQNSLAIEERVRALRQVLDPSGLSTSMIELAQTPTTEVRSALQAAPFFGGQRVVVLRGAVSARSSAQDDDGDAADDEIVATGARRSDWREIAALVPAVPGSTVVVCWVAGTLPHNHALSKQATTATWEIESFAIPRGADLLDWIGQRAMAIGTAIEPRAAEALLERLYPTIWRAETRWDNATISMHLIASELEKLAAGSVSGRIDTELVAALVVDRAGITAFRLGDQIFAGHPDLALIELDQMLAAGESSEKIVAQLATDVSGRSTARATSNLPSADVASALGVTPARLSTLRSKALAHDPAALGGAAELLREADASVKTGKLRNTSEAIIPLVADLSLRFSGRRGRSTTR